MSTEPTKPCSYCGEPIVNHGGYAWFHPNGLMLCDRTSHDSEEGDRG